MFNKIRFPTKYLPFLSKIKDNRQFLCGPKHVFEKINKIFTLFTKIFNKIMFLTKYLLCLAIKR